MGKEVQRKGRPQKCEGTVGKGVDMQCGQTWLRAEGIGLQPGRGSAVWRAKTRQPEELALTQGLENDASCACISLLRESEERESADFCVGHSKQQERLRLDFGKSIS